MNFGKPTLVFKGRVKINVTAIGQMLHTMIKAGDKLRLRGWDTIPFTYGLPNNTIYVTGENKYLRVASSMLYFMRNHKYAPVTVKEIVNNDNKNKDTWFTIVEFGYTWSARMFWHKSIKIPTGILKSIMR